MSTRLCWTCTRWQTHMLMHRCVTSWSPTTWRSRWRPSRRSVTTSLSSKGSVLAWENTCTTRRPWGIKKQDSPQRAALVWIWKVIVMFHCSFFVEIVFQVVNQQNSRAFILDLIVVVEL